MTEDEAQQAGRPATTVSMPNKRPPFRLRLRLACFHISLCFLRFDISFFFCFAFCGFFLCAALVAPFVGRLVARATAEGKRERERASSAGSGLRNGLQFYLGDVTNAISVSHMCKNVFRFMRAPTPTGCVSCPDVIRHTRTQS